MSSRFTVPTRKIVNSTSISIILYGCGYEYRKKHAGSKYLQKDGSDFIVNKCIDSVFSAYPNADLVLIVGFEADGVIKRLKRKVRIVENQIFEQTNIAEEIRLGLNNCIYDDILLINGSSLFESTVIRDITQFSSCVLYDPYTISNPNDIGITIVDDYATYFAPDLGNIWSGISFLTGKELKLMKEVAGIREWNKLFLFELLNEIINKGGKILTKQTSPKQVKIL